MKNLEQYIELINNSPSPEDAFTHYCNIMKQHGYARVVYSLMTDHPSLGLPRQHGLVSSYPQHWIDYYNESGYMDIDPVANELMRTHKPFFWSDLMQKKKDIAEPALQLMNEAQESGICNGLAFSIPSKLGEVAAIGLAQTETERTKSKDYNLLACAHLLSIYFHETYRTMKAPKLNTSLTKRETEVLSWASEGKTDEEIAILTNISQNTVRFHWKNIFSKLEAYGRVYAITKALRLNLISPTLICLPTKNGSVI